MVEKELTRLRLILLETGSSRPRDVTAITRVEMSVKGPICQIDAPQVHRFGSSRPECTWGDLADAATSPAPADILVAHDLARVKELIPDELTNGKPWIGTGRLLLQAAPLVPAWGAEAACAWFGQTAVLDDATGNRGPLVREGIALGLLVQHLYAELGLERMVRFSAYKTRPLGPAPRLNDDRGWADLPYDDLKWLATFAEGAAIADLPAEQLLDRRTGDRALREFNRRRIWARPN